LMHRHCLIRNVLEGFVREIVAGVKKPLGFEASQKFHSIRSALQYSLRSHLLSKLEKYLILKCNVYLLPMTKEVSKWKVMTHTTQNVEHEDIMLHDKYPKPLDLGDLSLEDLERVLEGWRKSFTEVTTQNIANGYVDQINKWQSLIVSQAHEESPGMTLN